MAELRNKFGYRNRLVVRGSLLLTPTFMAELDGTADSGLCPEWRSLKNSLDKDWIGSTKLATINSAFQGGATWDGRLRL